MDPLSEVLALLKPKSYAAGGYAIHEGLSVQFPRHQGLKCYAMISGSCWVCVEGEQPTLLQAGDCYLLPRGLPFVLTSDLSLTPVDFAIPKAEGRFVAGPPPQDGKTPYLAGGHFSIEGGTADILLRTLPPVVHIRKEADKAAMRWSMERMAEELSDPRPGGALIAQQLAYTLLIQALRLHLRDPANGASWLFALSDPQMRSALTAMHDNPAHPWTLKELAAKAAMSRSVFAERFKATVGATPMEYLTRWRMLLAGDRLRSSRQSLAEIASALGYDSESAFGKAFRRTMGASPRQYGRTA